MAEEKRTHDKMMAADLKRKGIYHDRRLTSTNVWPPMSYGPGSRKMIEREIAEQAKKAPH